MIKEWVILRQKCVQKCTFLFRILNVVQLSYLDREKIVQNFLFVLYRSKDQSDVPKI